MKKDIFNITVTLNSQGYRIDKFLQSQINELSRTRLQALIRDGQVKLNNIIINSSSKKISEEDKIEVNFPTPKETLIKPTPTEDKTDEKSSEEKTIESSDKSKEQKDNG